MAIKGKMKIVLATFAAAFVGVFATLAPVSAADSAKQLCPDGKKWVNDYSQCSNIDQKTDLMGVISTIINVLLGVIGFVAVIMIILGGISYTTSQGDATKVKKAKDTILYGVIGVVVALLAYAIVNFVLVNVFGSK